MFGLLFYFSAVYSSVVYFLVVCFSVFCFSAFCFSAKGIEINSDSFITSPSSEIEGTSNPEGIVLTPARPVNKNSYIKEMLVERKIASLTAPKEIDPEGKPSDQAPGEGPSDQSPKKEQINPSLKPKKSADWGDYEIRWKRSKATR